MYRDADLPMRKQSDRYILFHAFKTTCLCVTRSLPTNFVYFWHLNYSGFPARHLLDSCSLRFMLFSFSMPVQHSCNTSLRQSRVDAIPQRYWISKVLVSCNTKRFLILCFCILPYIWVAAVAVTKYRNHTYSSFGKTRISRILVKFLFIRN